MHHSGLGFAVTAREQTQMGTAVYHQDAAERWSLRARAQLTPVDALSVDPGGGSPQRQGRILPSPSPPYITPPAERENQMEAGFPP